MHVEEVHEGEDFVVKWAQGLLDVEKLPQAVALEVRRETFDVNLMLNLASGQQVSLVHVRAQALIWMGREGSVDWLGGPGCGVDLNDGTTAWVENLEG